MVSQGILQQAVRQLQLPPGMLQDSTRAESSGNYTVDHTSRIYAIDKNGNYRLTYPYDIDASAIVEDVRHLVEEGLQ